MMNHIQRVSHLERALRDAIEAAGGTEVRLPLENDSRTLDLMDVRFSMAIGCGCPLGIVFGVAYPGGPYEAESRWGAEGPIRNTHRLMKLVADVASQVLCDGKGTGSHRIPSHIDVLLEGSEDELHVVSIEPNASGIQVNLRRENTHG